MSKTGPGLPISSAVYWQHSMGPHHQECRLLPKQDGAFPSAALSTTNTAQGLHISSAVCCQASNVFQHNGLKQQQNGLKQQSDGP